MEQQVGLERLLQRRSERVDELMRQLADEADGVGQQVSPPGDLERARGRVERVEEPVANADLGPGERVEQRRLAGVGVAGERDGRQRGAVALAAHHLARAVLLVEPALERGDSVARQPAVGLDLALARAPGADSGAEALQVGPQPAHPREVVLELRQLDLQHALGAVRVVGEDVEDDRRAVDHRHADGLLEIALLARQQLVVARDEVGVGVLDRLLELGELALAEVAVGIGLRTLLGHLADDGRTGGAQQLAQLAEVGLLRPGGDAERALAGARRPLALAVAALARASVASPIHPPTSLGGG